jgi:diaminopimelate decarboxylase
MPTAGSIDEHDIVCLERPFDDLEPCIVAGPLCTESDVFSCSALLPKRIQEGDLLLILASGAYTVSRATNFIRPRAPVVAVDGDSVELCWRRETYQDIFSFHRATRFESALE